LDNQEKITTTLQFGKSHLTVCVIFSKEKSIHDIFLRYEVNK